MEHINAKEYNKNPSLDQSVEPNNDLKNMLVEYVGERLSPKDQNVTVEMIIDVVSEEFPEFLMAFAEENWVRGYHQALEDITEGERMALEEMQEQVKKECDKQSCGECECD